MRQPARANRSKVQVSTVRSMPAPIGGLNSRDPYALMAPTDAIELENFIPLGNLVRTRNGFAEWAPLFIPGVKASATLTFTGTDLTDGDTVTIGTHVYTFKTTLTGAADEVLIGLAAESLPNLKSAVNGAAGAGTTYGTGTVANADVDATTLTGTTVLLFVAKTVGVAGNSIAKAESAAELSWDVGATFSGGADDAADAPVESLMEWSGTSGSKFFAAADANIYEVTTQGPVGVPDVTGMTNARWQHTMMSTSGGTFLIIVNGEDTPHNYNGTAWATTPAITGPTATKLIGVALYQNRLWFIEKDSLNPWYLDTDQGIGGSATKFFLAPFCKRGGYLLAIGNWTLDSGSGSDDLIAFVTSEGEVLVYHIPDPSDPATIELKGIYLIPRPIGRRCLIRYGADLVVITENGYYEMSKALITGQVRNDIALSDKIRNLVTDEAQRFGGNFGWQPVFYPKSGWLMFNVPLSDTTSEQHLMTTTTNSWCRFSGMNALCWSTFAGNLYFGAPDGVVYLADFGSSDTIDGEDQAISAKIKTAFNYFGDQTREKHVKMVRPTFLCEGRVTPALGLNFDFQITEPTGQPTFSGSAGSPWNTSPWVDDEGSPVTPWATPTAASRNWVSLGGIGYAVSLSVNTQNQAFTLALAAIDYCFEPGGIL